MQLEVSEMYGPEVRLKPQMFIDPLAFLLERSKEPRAHTHTKIEITSNKQKQVHK